ncbi:methyltransferase [Virgisporangium aliadipatigenens]|uniref:Methyltransferase n=1 Tax=Virgisporangium aliadipatigenens TaxID=741659 RepID=A0A8J3YF69_9ACTN|nr:class I SAM-dependent methyltransferase [Virgisporangium aliadipatigenens]GIJ43307.1 methyltransferase [Virgisporangium aliadipatigenens]
MNIWAAGDAYERYVGRWSRRVAVSFVAWLGRPSGLRWLDVGCGTGALSGAVLAHAAPGSVLGVDPSAGFVGHGRARVDDPRLRFAVGDARALPLPGGAFDTVISGLMLNFVPRTAEAVAEFVRVTAPGGTAAAYVWDYGDGMELMRHFWDAAASVDPASAEHDEGRRFATVCSPARLESLWAAAGLVDVRTRGISVPTVFADFDDYWTPFLGGTGPAPGYVATLADARREALRETLRARLPFGDDGSIALSARAWAVRGTVPA